MQKKLLKYFALALFISSASACSESQTSRITQVNDNSGEFSILKNDKIKKNGYTQAEKALYKAHSKALKALKPQKLFNGTSKDLGPDPSNTVRSSSNVPEMLDLNKNRMLKDEIFGADYEFPSERFANLPAESSQSEFSVKTCCGTGKLHMGARIEEVASPTNNKWGVYAGMTVDASLSLPDVELLYSPTLMPPNESLLEVTTVYDRWHNNNGGPINRFIGVWNHATSGFKVPMSINDSTFTNNYVGSFSDGQFYFVQILKTDSASSEYETILYNFQTSQWDQWYSDDQGTFASGFVDGWIMHEPKWDDICPTFQNIKASGVQAWDGSTWYDNTPASGATRIMNSLTCNNWNFNFINDYYEWQIND